MLTMTHFALFLFLLGSPLPLSGAECEIVTMDALLLPGDESRAKEGCEMARSRFTELFGGSAPGVRVRLWNEPSYRIGLQRGQAVIIWPTSLAMAPRGADGEFADSDLIEAHLEEQWSTVLPHEIAHLLLAARFFPERPAAPDGGYGTPFPDWLDEAVAIWAEPKENRRRRLEQARELSPTRLDLDSILGTPHPASGNAAAYTPRDGSARQADDALWAFYPQAIAVLTFIHELGGSIAVQELADRLVVDPNDPLAILGLPGLPTDTDALLAAWEDWLAATPPTTDDAGRQ
jgi:hypothetical protein